MGLRLARDAIKHKFSVRHLGAGFGNHLHAGLVPVIALAFWIALAFVVLRFAFTRRILYSQWCSRHARMSVFSQ
jgi:hypothetical protein